MKYIQAIILVLAIFINVNAQLLNSEFDSWMTIDTFGQPYEDLKDWSTNNEVLVNGVATTPSIRIVVGGDVGVSLTSSYQGIDGAYSGVISQYISSDHLTEIAYLSKCDSIFEKGACVVNLYDQTNRLIYSDSTKTSEASYIEKVIDMSQFTQIDNQLIKIEFMAFGQIGPFELFQAYSTFNLLSVNANYISSTVKYEKGENVIYPNPFSSKLKLDIKNVADFKAYRIYNLSGQLLLSGKGYEIETNHLDKETYIIELIFEGGVDYQKLIKH